MGKKPLEVAPVLVNRAEKGGGGREKGGVENMAKRRKVSEIYSENNSKIFNCLKIREFLRLPVFRGDASNIYA
jgi:hypothetical protein